MVETRVGENIHFWAATDVGRVRDHNEDNFLVDKTLNLFVVADGMGGHAAGEVASAIAVNSLRDVMAQNTDLIQMFREGSAIASNRDVLSVLEHAVQKACHEIFDMAQEDQEKRGMGTTLSALLVIGSHGFIAHVGDSRIFLVRGGRVVQLTEDHSLVNELIKRGKLTREQAEQSPYKNAVTRAVGVYESVEVDTIDFDVLPGDQFMLCSDGLHGYLKNEEVPPLMEEDASIETLPKIFIDLANERGGKDNITVIVVRVEDPEGRGSDLSREVNLKIEAIRRMPLFKFLSYKEAVRVMNTTKVRDARPGEGIVKEGDEGDELFIVLQGSVRVHKQETTIVTLGPGDHFGEMALIDKAPRSADVSAVDSARLLVISRNEFFKIIRNEPPLATKLLWSFLQVLTDRLRTTSNELSDARAPAVEELDLFEIEPDEVES